MASLAFSGLARAEEPPQKTAAPPQNAVALDLGLHVVGLGYQRTLSPRVAFFGALDWYVPWTQTTSTLDTMGAVVRLRPFFFLLQDAPRGLWVSPFMQAGFARADRPRRESDSGGETRVGFAGAVGASVGYALLLADRIYLSAGIGAQLHAVRIRGGDGGPSFVGPYVHADALVGYAF